MAKDKASPVEVKEPVKKPVQDAPVNIVEEYDDSVFDPEIHALPTKESLQEYSAAPVVERPRDPETGQFLPAKQVAASVPSSSATHPARLLRTAAELGFSDAEVAEMATDRLEDAVHFATLHLAKERRERQATSVSAGDRATDDFITTSREPGEPTAKVLDSLGIDEGQYDTALVQLLKEQKKEIADLRKSMGELHQRERFRHAETVDEKIVRQFELLTPQYKSFIGEIFGSVVPKDLPEYGRQVAILGEARRLAGPKASVNDQIRMMGAAAKNLFGSKAAVPDEPNEEAIEPVNGDLKLRQERWNASALAKPTQRHGAAEPKGVRLAEKNVAAKLREMRAGQGEEEDDLL